MDWLLFTRSSWWLDLSHGQFLIEENMQESTNIKLEIFTVSNHDNFTLLLVALYIDVEPTVEMITSTKLKI